MVICKHEFANKRVTRICGSDMLDDENIRSMANSCHFS